MRRFAFVVFLSTALGFAHGTSTADAALLSSPFVTGSELYSAADLAPVFGAHVGKQVTRELLDQISAELQALYRRDGYVVPQIVALSSELDSSTPRLHVFEARIAEVAIRGETGPYLQTIMDQANLLESNVIHKERSLRYFRRLEELPGLRLRAAFEPRGDQPNRYALVLNLSYDAVRANVSLHNRGTEDLGRTMVAARATFNGLLGAQEAVSLVGAASTEPDKYHYVGGRIERRFGRVGTQLDLSSSRASYDSDYTYSSERAQMKVSVAGYDDGAWRIDPFTAFSARNGLGARSSGLTLSEINTRVFETGIAARRASSGATTYLWTAFARGIDGLGASASTLYGAPAELDFKKSTFELLHLHTLTPAWRVRLNLDAQWSADDLPAGERFTFGGARLGRAFDPAALIGDSGAAMSIQLERHQRWKHAWLRNSKVYVQSDYGYAEDNEAHDDRAASATVGMSAAIAATLTSLELSYPLLSPEYDADSEGLRAFFLMQLNF